MNGLSQHSYGGSIKERDLVFRGQEIRERRWHLLKILFAICVAATIVWSVFNIAAANAEQDQESTSTSSQAVVIEQPYLPD